MARNGTVGRRNGLMARRPLFSRKRQTSSRVGLGTQGILEHALVLLLQGPRILSGMQLLPDAACGAEGRATVGRCDL
jgi:hypothetical protein